MNNFDFKTSAWQSEGSASKYDQSTRSASTVFNIVRFQIYIEYVQKYAAPGARILDVGCGSGLVAIALHDLGYDVVAYDASQDMLAYLRGKMGSRKIETRHSDGKIIPGEEGEFDLTLSRMFIQHFVEWPTILAQKARVTKPGGVILYDFANQEHLDRTKVTFDGGAGFPYDNDQTNTSSYYAAATAEAMERQALSLGLEVLEISPIGLLLYNGSVWNRLKKEGVTTLNRRLDELLEKDGAREMLLLVEREIVPYLPKSSTYGNMTALKRKLPPG